MARQKSHPNPEDSTERDVLARLETAISFQEMIGDGDIELDQLANHFIDADIKAGANRRRPKESDYNAIYAALPKDLQDKLRQYIDDVEAKTISYAEAGYFVGLAAARALGRLSGGMR